jgi:hypothetical protein
MENVPGVSGADLQFVTKKVFQWVPMKIVNRLFNAKTDRLGTAAGYEATKCVFGEASQRFITDTGTIKI